MRDLIEPTVIAVLRICPSLKSSDDASQFNEPKSFLRRDLIRASFWDNLEAIGDTPIPFS